VIAGDNREIPPAEKSGRKEHTMAVLTWQHGTSQGKAIAAIVKAVKKLGYEGYVTWKDGTVEASAGPFATLVNARGEVTDDRVILAKAGGLLGGKVLTRCREILEDVFPGGEQR
jgi:hypothetical protein